MTRWPFGLHWAARAYDQVRPLGCSYVWLNADTIGDPAYADDIAAFVAARIPEHTSANRRYLTVAVGCTGGQHRSVYVVNRLAEHFTAQHPLVSVRHNELHSRHGG